MNKKKRKGDIKKIEANTNKFNKFFSLQPRYGFSSMIVPTILNRKKIIVTLKFKHNEEKFNHSYWWCGICRIKSNYTFSKKTNFRIISIDNYSTGLKKNHVKDKRVKYLIADTKEISKVLKKYKNKINAIFHFGEFSRIYQSFLKMNECINSIQLGLMKYLIFVYLIRLN